VDPDPDSDPQHWRLTDPGGPGGGGAGEPMDGWVGRAAAGQRGLAAHLAAGPQRAGGGRGEGRPPRRRLQPERSGLPGT
jgi:hypothetical protein